MYRTGDRARYLPDGNIEFLGRVDQQVKIRGFRVEPGEIEAVLKQHPAVRQTVVVAAEDKGGDKRLVAYVVAAGAGAMNADQLRGFLSEKLPDYMVPAIFVALKELPLTANGKVDRKALPDPDEAPKQRGEFLASRNPVEEAIALIWAEVLGRVDGLTCGGSVSRLVTRPDRDGPSLGPNARRSTSAPAIADCRRGRS